MTKPRRERLGLGGSVKAAMKGTAAEGFGGDVYGLPMGLAIGLWWWVRGTPVTDKDIR